MSINANFNAWCQLRGLNPRPAAYLNDSMWNLAEGDARIIRMVDQKKRAGNRETQTYIVEVLVNDTISYPLGTKPMDKKELLRKLIRSTMERSA